MKRSQPRRKKPLPRASHPIARHVGVKAKNVKRAAQNHARAYGDKAAWIRLHPCCACGYLKSEAAHVGSGGMGRKADSTMLVPLCGVHTILEDQGAWIYAEQIDGCHADSHRGVETFQAVHGINLRALAAAYEAQWQVHLARTFPNGRSASDGGL